MAERQIDPARLEGEALRRWYSRSPDQIQRQRQAAEHRRKQVFFDRAQSANGHAPPPPTRWPRAARTQNPACKRLPQGMGR